jgi:DNA adenine methylase
MDFLFDLRNASSFLHWAGGKHQIVEDLIKRLPTTFDVYHEPFIGGGALFFDLWNREFITEAQISDANASLITTYQQIQTHPSTVLQSLEKYTSDLSKDRFYQLKDTFNDHRNILQDHDLAALFIYLNKTAFNGLYRVNSKGQFNTSYGTPKKDASQIYDSDNIEECSRALQIASIHNRGYQESLSVIKQGDFVYMDPPYVPLSKTSSFTGYSEIWKNEDHFLLSESCRDLDNRNVLFMLSNSDTDLVREYYKGFNIESIPVRRNVSGDGTKRGMVNEVIVRNY